jgi:hypothetical protein
VFEKGFKFTGIKKEAKALRAAFNEKFAVYAKINGLEGDVAERTDSFLLTFMGSIVVNAGQIDIVATATIIADNGVLREWR